MISNKTWRNIGCATSRRGSRKDSRCRHSTLSTIFHTTPSRLSQAQSSFLDDPQNQHHRHPGKGIHCRGIVVGSNGGDNRHRADCSPRHKEVRIMFDIHMTNDINICHRNPDEKGIVYY